MLKSFFPPYRAECAASARPAVLLSLIAACGACQSASDGQQLGDEKHGALSRKFRPVLVSGMEKKTWPPQGVKVLTVAVVARGERQGAPGAEALCELCFR